MVRVVVSDSEGHGGDGNSGQWTQYEDSTGRQG